MTTTGSEGAGLPGGKAPSRIPLPILALALLLALWTAAILLFPGFRFVFRWSRARLPIETAGFLVAVLTSGLAYLRWSLTGSRRFLYLSLAFVPLAVQHLVFGVLVSPGRLDFTGEQAVYFWTAGRLAAAGLLLAGLIARRAIAGSPSGAFLRRLAAVLIGLGIVDAVLWAVREDLPALSSGLAGGVDLPGSLPGLTAVDLLLGVTGGVLFLVVAAVLLRDRGPSDPSAGILSAAFVLAAFSHLHYMFLPTVFTTRVSTGDLLRVGFSVALLLGLVLDVRATYLSERRRAADLAMAYRVERRRAEELEGLERSRVELMQIVTHELLHPVATLRGSAVTLARRWDRLAEAERRELVSIMERETKRLRDLAEHAAEAVAGERSTFSISPRPEPAEALLAEAADTSPELRGAVGVVVDPSASGAVVRAERTRLLQVFRNLLDNARKYAGGGPVTITAAGDDREVTFSVHDRGPGIAEADLPRLFQRFSRIAGGGDGRGSGLGLYISRRIVEAHGGRMWVESEVGVGSSFRFTVPRWEEG
ncbi:MAG: HAMP domain-containing histidine kinase [Actinobacteria bacterium]|nr:HAMP domain-containing histidine kinase [Actinomycetota bacterium]